jgi:putative membrane protein
MKPTTIVLAAALLALAPISTSELTSTVKAATAVSGEDFVKTAGAAGMFEIESSKIAATKAKNADVKSFAQRMITDHTKAAEELKAATKKAGPKYNVPTALDPKGQKMMDELNAADPAKFDSIYVRMQTQAHMDAVALFERYAKQGDEPALKEFAAKTLPTLQEHYDMINRIGSSLNMAQNQPANTQGVSTNQNATETAATQPPATSTDMFAAVPPDAMLSYNLVGLEIYNNSNDDVGEIKDLVIENGQMVGFIASIGGFLGLGERYVVLNPSAVEITFDEPNNKWRATMNATKEQLQSAPEFKYEGKFKHAG